MAKEIKDFGQKIGGARKDFYAEALKISDAESMTDVERRKSVKRDNIWPKDDPIELVNAGMPQSVAYWRNEMRLSVLPKPKGYTDAEIEKYINVVSSLRDGVATVKTEKDIENFVARFNTDVFPASRSYAVPYGLAEVLGPSIIKTMRMSVPRVRAEAINCGYGLTAEDFARDRANRRYGTVVYGGSGVEVGSECGRTALKVARDYGCEYFYERDHADSDWRIGTYVVIDKVQHKIEAKNLTAEAAERLRATLAKTAADAEIERNANQEKKNTDRKQRFPIPELTAIHRTGPEYLGRDAKDTDFLGLGIRGGEFGNWLTDADAQANLTHCYNAFRDLAEILGIKPEDIALDGTLSIAFGARGQGAAAAHYEAERRVINLTKMSGMGCLAHEWAHALDDHVGRKLGLPLTESGAFCTGSEISPAVPAYIKDVMRAIKYKNVSSDSPEIQAAAAANVEKYRTWAKSWIDPCRPKTMTTDQQEKWDAASAEILAHPEAAEMGCYRSIPGIGGGVNPYIEKLSGIRKEITGHAIPKDQKVKINGCMASVRSAMATKAEEVRVKTDFYKGSQAFDAMFRQTGHGYWASNAEMFARALDCYVHDKAKEMGIDTPYLSGKSGSFVFGDNAAIPLGAERTHLNGLFDKMIDGLKRDGILHSAVRTSTIAMEDQATLGEVKAAAAFSRKSTLEDIKKIADQGRTENTKIGRDSLSSSNIRPTSSDRSDSKQIEKRSA